MTEARSINSMGAPVVAMYDREELKRWKRATWWFSVIFLVRARKWEMCADGRVVRQVVGAVVLTASLWLQLSDVGTTLDSSLPIGYLVTGSFTILVSFVGWFSSTRESKKLLFFVRGSLFMTVLTSNSTCSAWSPRRSSRWP